MRQVLTEIKGIKHIEGQKILKVWRLFSEEPFEEIPENVREQESDGILYLLFSGGELLSFHPLTEKFSVIYCYLDISELPNKAKEITHNSFWQKRIGKEIVEISFFYSNFCNNLNPIGLKIDFKNNVNVKIQYISESDHTFDALVVRGW